ncbi:hypothetical protein AB833_32410 [Chromatiales bacterium (ex Bugula neritina AB1)]|nr:hypothetical protein AB833_32410 [Chromatiales bacterium (ex Bugula neritina AB1)]
MDFITGELSPWHWLTAGVLMCAIELFAPTTFLLWPGTAAILTGLITFLIPILGWELQVALFAMLTVATTLAGRVFFKRDINSDQPSLNRRGDSHIGREVTLSEAIVNGTGAAIIDNSRWRVVGTDAPVNTRVTVTGLNGASLEVEITADS